MILLGMIIFDKKEFQPLIQIAAIRFIGRLRSGDLSLDADLLTACENRDENWHPRMNSCDISFANS